MPGRLAVALDGGPVQVPTVARNPSACLVAGLMILAAVAPGCDRAAGPGSAPGTVTLVNRVRATMRGASCADCGARLEAALAQRLDPATITVGPLVDRVDVEFQRAASPFSSSSFRSAVGQLGGEVLSVQIEACGTIDATAQGSWLTSGSTRLMLEGTGPWTSATEICVTGELRDDVLPARLVAGKFRS